MMRSTAKRHLGMACKNVNELRPENLSACRGFGSCLERYVEELEKAGQKFFEDADPMEILCNAQTCRWNERGHCAMEFGNDNLHSLDESGRCRDYMPR